MIHKSRNYFWNDQEITLEIDGTARSKVIDSLQITGFRDIKISFTDWLTPKGPDNISLCDLYKDVYPEFVNTNNEFDTEKFKEFFPEVELIFQPPTEPLPLPPTKTKKQTKTKTKAKTPISLSQHDLLRLKEELKKEILEEIMTELNKKPELITGYIIQKDKAGNIIRTFINQADASNKTKISKSSISQALSNKIKSAGGFIWEFNI